MLALPKRRGESYSQVERGRDDGEDEGGNPLCPGPYSYGSGRRRVDGGACTEVQEGQGAHAYDPVRKEPRLTSRTLIQLVIRYMRSGRRHVDGLKRDTDTNSPTKLCRLLRGIAGIPTVGARARGRYASEAQSHVPTIAQKE